MAAKFLLKYRNEEHNLGKRMQYFTIKDIENLSGIKAHTWRIWEQRYNLFIPKRKESLRRIYDIDDLKKLLQIAFLYHNGWKISNIAELSAGEIVEQVRKTEISNQTYENFILQLIVAAVDFNEADFVQLLDDLTGKIGFEKCIKEVCYPYLQRVGLLWVTRSIIPAQEQFSSYIIQNKIIAETEKISVPSNGAQVVLFSPHGEFHELPLLFLNYLLKKNGWSVIYLGSNVTREVLKAFTVNKKVGYLFFHLVTNFTGWDADTYFEELCRSFHDKTIIAAGTVVHQMQRSFTNMKLLKSDKEIYTFIGKQGN